MKLHLVITVGLLFLAVISAIMPIKAISIEQRSSSAIGYFDALTPPDLPSHSIGISSAALAQSSLSPGYYETSEYFIGIVAVGIVFLESNGVVDTSTEYWTSTEESNVVSKINTALTWWATQNPSASVSFRYDTIHYRVPTRYEPINRPHTDESLWIGDAMSYLGYSGTYYFTQVRDYVNALRTSLNADWAFAIFVVDSSNDADGSFTDQTPQGWYYSAYAYLGGPFLVMTYDNDGWGIGNMDRVTAHEAGHIFYATDEYNGVTEYSGYLNVADVEGSGALMDNSNWLLSAGTLGQIGWRDSDGDGLQDIVDTFPDTNLVPYSPNPMNDPTPTYYGVIKEVPYPNNNPQVSGSDVTINTITNVEYRVDLGVWLQASAADGFFDEAEEDFNFTISALSSGIHNIQTRGKNSVANVETSFAGDTVTVDLTAPSTSLSYSSPNYVNDTKVYLSKSTNFTFTASDSISGVANTFYKLDSGLWKQYATKFTLGEITDGAHTLYYYSTDKAGNKEITKSFNITSDNSGPTITFTYPNAGSALNSKNFNVSWIGLDSGSGVDHYEIRIDNGTFISRELLTSHIFSSVAEGNHTVNVKAVDKLGNTKVSSIVFLVDTSAPTISIDSPLVNLLTNLSAITASWHASDTISGIDHYEVKLDDRSWLNAGTFTMYPLSQISDGSHKLAVKAVDKAGNLKESSVEFLVDTTPPSLSIVSPKNGSEVKSSTLILVWNGADAISGIDHFEIQLDEIAWINTGTNRTYKLTSIGDGTHTLHFKVVDKSGNSQEVRTDFTVNTSLIGGPGWLDDALAFGAVSIGVALVLGLLLKKRSK